MSTNIGVAIKITRKRKGISQEKLANLCNIARSYVYYLESGKSSPTIDKLDAISHVLGCKSWEILKLADEIKLT